MNDEINLPLQWLHWASPFTPFTKLRKLPSADSCMEIEWSMCDLLKEISGLEGNLITVSPQKVV